MITRSTSRYFATTSLVFHEKETSETMVTDNPITLPNNPRIFNFLPKKHFDTIFPYIKPTYNPLISSTNVWINHAFFDNYSMFMRNYDQKITLPKEFVLKGSPLDLNSVIKNYSAIVKILYPHITRLPKSKVEEILQLAILLRTPVKDDDISYIYRNNKISPASYSLSLAKNILK